MRYALVASNEQKIHEELKLVLGKEFNFLCANSAQDALLKAAENNFDIIFLDENLYDTNVFNLAKRFKELEESTSIILLKESENVDKINMKQSNFYYEILQKPLITKNIKSSVYKALKYRDLARENIYLRNKLLNSSTKFSFDQYFETINNEKYHDKNVYHHQLALKELFKALIHMTDLDKLLDFIIHGISTIFSINKISVMLLDTSAGGYKIKASLGLKKSICNDLFLKSEEGIVAWFIRNNQILTIEELDQSYLDWNKRKILYQLESLSSKLSIPLFAKGSLIGILNLGNKITGKPFFESELELLTLISNYLAIAIENSLLYKELSLQERYKESILDNISSGVISIDLNGKVKIYNKAAEKIMKFKRQEILGKNIQKLGSIFANIMLSTLEDGKIYSRHEINHPLTKAPIGISTSLLRYEEEYIDGAIMVFTDLSEAKELEEKKKVIERLKFWSNLAKRMAQEIRNPLVAIRTFAELLPEKYMDKDFRNEYYNIVISELNRLNLITEKLLEFAEPREGEYEYADINEVLEIALMMLEKKIFSSKAKIIKQYTSHPLKIKMDKMYMEQAFCNIIENCLEAIEEGGCIKIKTYIQKSFFNVKIRDSLNIKRLITIEFDDNGSGIPEDHLKDIFLPFFTTKINRMGFGLSIAQRIINDHDGKIEVKSKEGKGSQFFIYFPISQAINI